MSHDGRYLYVACEGSAKGMNPNTGQKYSDPTNVEQTETVMFCARVAGNTQTVPWKLR